MWLLHNVGTGFDWLQALTQGVPNSNLRKGLRLLAPLRVGVGVRLMTCT